MKRGSSQYGWGICLFAFIGMLAACDKPRQEPRVELPPPPPVTAPEPPVDPVVQLGRQLRDTDPVHRRDAAVRLGEMAAAGQLPDGPLQQLINAFDVESDTDAQAAIIRALGQSCHPAAMDILVRSLKGDLSRVRGETLQVLGETGNFPVAEALDAYSLRLADDDSPLARAMILQADYARKRIMQRAGRRPECVTEQTTGGQ